MRYRRTLAGVFAVGLMAAAVAAMQGDKPGEHPLLIVFGLQDAGPSDWSGTIAVQEGDVVELAGWRFDPGDRIRGTTGWTCRTRNGIAPENRFPVTRPRAPARRTAVQPWPVGVTALLRGANPSVTLTLPSGEVGFQAADIRAGEPQSFLGGRITVERQPASQFLRPPPARHAENPVQDDYPALCIDEKSGKQSVAWVAYQDRHDRVFLSERTGPHGDWSEPVEVDGPGDHFRVALARALDTLWIVWAAQSDGAWNLFGRSYRDGKLGEPVALTEGAGPNLWHRMTSDSRGRAWLVWQGFRGGQSDIFVRCADAEGWHDPVRISTSPANDWDPTVAADPAADRVRVGWDTYDSGNYGVHVRSLSGGTKPQLGEILAPAPGPLFEAHVSLACDRAGRLWAAWDEAGPQWGKDYGFFNFVQDYSPGTRLYASRRVRVKCLQQGQWVEPARDLQDSLPLALHEFNELPQLQEDADGRMWLALRYRTCRYPRDDGWAAQGRWDFAATAYLGDRWLPAVELPHSAGRNDMRASSARDADGVCFAYATDGRGWSPPGMLPANSSIVVSRLDGAPPPQEARFVSRPAVLPVVVPVHAHEKEDLARIRSYAVQSGGKTYHIYRGDIHRHTDLSADGAGDGSIADLHRYALDTAALDYVFITDHNMGQDNEYCWWQTQKANDLYTVPKNFISMYGYERSVPYPDGHRNVIWTERGHRTLPVPRRRGSAEDTSNLYAYLRETGGICTLHTSATDQGTNWAEHDDSLEPFVEIFQGYHTSYEAPGAPKAVDDRTEQVHGVFRPDGFVSTALEKGYRLGFQASSDHVSTHTSYACLLAESFSRKGLVDAMRRRHSYAATDNIVLDVRMGELGIMGDEITTGQPRLDVVVLGTGPIDRIDVLRNGEVVHAESPDKDAREARFHWEDSRPVSRAQPSYYYVRVIQKDGQMAWASPIWVNVRK